MEHKNGTGVILRSGDGRKGRKRDGQSIVAKEKENYFGFDAINKIGIYPRADLYRFRHLGVVVSF